MGERWVTQAEFAKIAGVSKQMVSQYLKRGDLVALVKGDRRVLNLNEPKNLAFVLKPKKRTNVRDKNAKVLAKVAGQPAPKRPVPKKVPEKVPKKVPKKGTRKTSPKTKGKTKERDETASQKIDEIKRQQMQYLDKDEIQKLKLIAEMDKIKLSTDESRKLLISRELVAAVLGKLHTVDVQEFLTIPTKFAPHAAGLCGVDDNAIIHQLEMDLEEQLYRVLKHIKRIIDDFLDTTKSVDNEG